MILVEKWLKKHTHTHTHTPLTVVSSTTNQECPGKHVKQNNLGLEVPMLLFFGYGSWKIHGHEYPLNVFDASL